MPATIVPVPRQPPSEPDHRRDRRAEISAREASYLRTHEKFPSLPGSLWRLGRSYRVTARICVSREGRVSGVAIVEGTAADVNRILGKAMRAWRYRPRVVAGLPRPFCHLMNVQYSLR